MATQTSPKTAAAFAEAAGIDQYAFRKYLRSQGQKVGKGRHHKTLPSPTSSEGKKLIKAFNEA